MTYFDSVTMAVQRALDWDMPARLLPLTITHEASRMVRMDSDGGECA